MEQDKDKARRKLLLKLALALAVLLALGLALHLGLDLRALMKRGFEFISTAGPLVFFGAMAIMPGLGTPMLAFVLPAAPIFAERYGLGAVIAMALVAITVNFMLTYALARWAFRPLLTRLLSRLGYRMPALEGSDSTDLLIILRVTPGIPFCVQNYLAGLASVPLGRYIAISIVFTYAFNTGFLLFGEALLKGKGGLALFSIGALMALAAGTHLLRKRYARKGGAAGQP